MQAPPRTPGFHHVTLLVRELSTALPFWADTLGLRPPSGQGTAGAARLFLETPGEGAGRLLQLVEAGDAPKGRWGVGGVHHVALGVSDLSALVRWKRRLSDRGIDSSGPIDRGYFQSLYFSDPHGQVVELATAGPGYAIDEPPDALGEREIVPDPERLPGTPERQAMDALLHPHPVTGVTPDMEIQGIHHVSGITDDLEGAHTFVTGALGLGLVKRTVNQDDGRTRHWFWARYDGSAVASRSAYTLFGWPGSDHRARHGWGQTGDLAFRSGDHSLEEWQEHLQELGVATTDGHGDAPFTSIRFRAPDGQEFSIVADEPSTTPPTPGDP